MSREALRACECPGDNDDDEVLVPVDYVTLEEEFGFDASQEAALVDEDGRMVPWRELVGGFGWLAFGRLDWNMSRIQ